MGEAIGQIIMLIFLCAVGVGMLRALDSKKRKESEARQARMVEMHNKAVLDFQQAADVVPFRMNSQVATDAGITLLPREELILVAPVVMKRTVRSGTKYQGGSRGVRVTPIKGLSFNVGGHKGKFVADLSHHVDLGYFALTTKRLVFNGDAIKFALPMAKLNGASVVENELHVDASSREVPDFSVEFLLTGMAPVVAALLTNPDQSVKVEVTG